MTKGQDGDISTLSVFQARRRMNSARSLFSFSNEAGHVHHMPRPVILHLDVRPQAGIERKVIDLLHFEVNRGAKVIVQVEVDYI